MQCWSVRLVSIVRDFFSNFFDSLEGKTSGLVFLSRVTDNLASSSLFIENIDCNQRSAEGWSLNCVTSNSSDFFNRIQALHEFYQRQSHCKVVRRARQTNSVSSQVLHQKVFPKSRYVILHESIKKLCSPSYL